MWVYQAFIGLDLAVLAWLLGWAAYKSIRLAQGRGHPLKPVEPGQPLDPPKAA